MSAIKETDTDVEKGLKAFDKELDTYILIKRKIESSFTCMPSEMTKEARDLQIRLAKLNGNLQFYIAETFGLLATGIALAVFGIQIFLDQFVTYPQITIQMGYSLAILIISILAFIGVFKVRPNLKNCLDELNKLQ